MSNHAFKTSFPEVARRGVRPAEEQKATPALFGVLTANASFVGWLVSLGFGGALLVVYYSHIHYFPELEWKESLTYLAALSLLGGTVAVLYGLLLFFPGMIWAEFLIHDSKLEDKLCYRTDDHLEVCYWKVGSHMALPFFVFMLVMHFVALTKSVWIIGGAGIVLLAWISRNLWKLFREQIGPQNKENGEPVPDTKTGSRQSLLHKLVGLFDLSALIRLAAMKPGTTQSLLVKYVGLFNVSAVISLASLLILYVIADPKMESWLLLLICTLGVVVTNLLVAVQYRRRPGRAVVTAILAAIVLLACGESFEGARAALSSRLMEGFGIGSDQVTLIVEKGAIPILKGHNVPFEVRLGAVTIGNARILSRLGKEYFVEAGKRRVAIPRDLVLSWSAPVER